MLFEAIMILFFIPSSALYGRFFNLIVYFLYTRLFYSIFVEKNYGKYQNSRALCPHPS